MCRRRLASGATKSSRCAISDAALQIRWPDRAGSLLAGIWAGVLICVAAIATRAPFAVLEAPEAGRVAGRVLAYEANASVAFTVVLYLIVRRQARSAAAAGRGSVLSGDLLLVLGALFCTVAGYFALQPMMQAARGGLGHFSFGTLHVVSVVFFGLKTLLVLALAWRLGPR